jgi:hypothetical protein
VERRETFHYYYPMGVHPPGDLTVTAEPQMEFVRKALGFLEDGQTSCPSFFVYWGCAKETKIL